MKVTQPLVLAILDGFGIAPDSKSNAIATAKTPNLDFLLANYPHTQVYAAGKYVGLPDGQMGNSEVGHIHLGAGRTIFQSLTLINEAIKDQSFFKNKEFLAAAAHARKNKSAFHILGLLSDGGVHSHINHILALIKFAAAQKLPEIYVHAITDGRDTAKIAAKKYFKQLAAVLKQYPQVKLATVSGRYYTMDRDKRWDREDKAYAAIVNHQGEPFTDVDDYLDQQYQADITDEFIVPAVNQNTPQGYIKDHDAVIFANFRPDRAIQFASGLTNDKYLWVPQPRRTDLYFVSMMPYADSVASPHVAFKPQIVKNGFGEWISSHGYHQLRIAETEKYAHVTYFFDGGKDVVFPLEDRILIPSPKVATYDLKPAMSAVEITTALIKAIKAQKYDVIILNFANPDMVGHTGILPAAIKAIETVDQCLGDIYRTLTDVNGILIITADHGNAEKMVNADGTVCKTHTTSKVPVIITKKGLVLKPGLAISSVAPTMLELMGLEQPKEMTEPSLILGKTEKN